MAAPPGATAAREQIRKKKGAEVAGKKLGEDREGEIAEVKN